MDRSVITRDYQKLRESFGSKEIGFATDLIAKAEVLIASDPKLTKLQAIIDEDKFTISIGGVRARQAAARWIRPEGSHLENLTKLLTPPNGLVEHNASVIKLAQEFRSTVNACSTGS